VVETPFLLLKWLNERDVEYISFLSMHVTPHDIQQTRSFVLRSFEHQSESIGILSSIMSPEIPVAVFKGSK
jgi:hypothetical protein